MRKIYPIFLGSPASTATGKLWLPSKQILEPNLLVPQKKPVGQVEIDWDNSLANKLYEVWNLPDAGGLLRNWSGAWEGTYAKQGSIGGYGAHVTGGLSAHSTTLQGGAIDLGLDRSHIKNRDFSVFAVVVPEANIQQEGTIFGFGKNGFEVRLEQDYKLSALDTHIALLGTTTNSANTGSITTCGFTIDSNSTGNFVVSLNGVNTTGSTTRNLIDISSGSHAAIGQDYVLTASRWSEFAGSMLFIAYWQRELSLAEMASLHADPYQFLKPAGLDSYLSLNTEVSVTPPADNSVPWMSFF